MKLRDLRTVWLLIASLILAASAYTIDKPDQNRDRHGSSNAVIRVKRGKYCPSFTSRQAGHINPFDRLRACHKNIISLGNMYYVISFAFLSHVFIVRHFRKSLSRNSCSKLCNAKNTDISSYNRDIFFPEMKILFFLR